MDPQHLVISGGGAWGFLCYGALQQSAKNGMWNIKSIRSIYATSIGTLIAVMISVVRFNGDGRQVDWDFLDSFLINSAWDSVFSWNVYSLIDAIDNRGLFSITQIEKIITPLILRRIELCFELDETRIFKSPRQWTLLDFFNETNITMHFFTLNIHDNLTTVDLSHLTHPDWLLMDAVAASCAVPVLFCPKIISEDECYVDGGFFYNYPLHPCVDAVQKNSGELTAVLGFKQAAVLSKQVLRQDSSLFDYLIFLLMVFIGFITKQKDHPSTSQKSPLSARSCRRPPTVVEIEIPFSFMNIMDVFNVISSKETRERYIEDGKRAVGETPH
jgi:predicted acylesterase/phospholipase RssA